MSVTAIGERSATVPRQSRAEPVDLGVEPDAAPAGASSSGLLTPGQDQDDDRRVPEPPAAGLLTAALAEQLEAAFGSTYQACLRTAVRIVWDAALAEEVVQEAFLAAWQHAPTRYDPARGPLGSWLTTLTRHKAIDAVRHAEHLRRVQRSEQALTPPHRHEAAAEDTAVRSSAARRLRSAVLKLSADQQRVLLLAYWAGLPHSQIALRDGTPLGTVKTRTAAALTRLRELIPDREDYY